MPPAASYLTAIRGLFLQKKEMLFIMKQVPVAYQSKRND